MNNYAMDIFTRIFSLFMICILLTGSIVTTEMAAAQPGTSDITISWYSDENGEWTLIGTKVLTGVNGDTAEIDPIMDSDGIDYVEGKNNQNVIWSSYTADSTLSDDGNVIFGETNTVDFYLTYVDPSTPSEPLFGPLSLGWTAEIYQVVNKINTSTNPASMEKEFVKVKTMDLSYAGGEVTVPATLLDNTQINKDTTTHQNNLSDNTLKTYSHQWVLNDSYPDGQAADAPGNIAVGSSTGVLKFYYEPPNWQYEYDFDTQTLNTSRAIVYTNIGWFELMSKYETSSARRNLFENNEITHIRLGADINQKDDQRYGTFYVNRKKASLEIDGAKDPANPGTSEEHWYKFVQWQYTAPFTSGYLNVMRLHTDDGLGDIGSSAAPLTDVNWKNSFLIGGNGYGLFTTIGREGVTYNYENILYVGPQLIWNSYGDANIKDAEIVIEDPRIFDQINYKYFNGTAQTINLNLSRSSTISQGYWGEFAEVNKVNLSGNISVYKGNRDAEGTSVAIFQIWNNNGDGKITILPDSDVQMVHENTRAGDTYYTPFVKVPATVNLEIGDNSTFNFMGDHAFSEASNNIKNFDIKENATVNLISNNIRNITIPFISFNESLIVGENATLNVTVANDSNRSAVRFNGSIFLDNNSSMNIIGRTNKSNPMVETKNIDISRGADVYIINHNNGTALKTNNLTVDKLALLHVAGMNITDETVPAANVTNLKIDRAEDVVFYNAGQGKGLHVRDNNTLTVTNMEHIRYWNNASGATYNLDTGNIIGEPTSNWLHNTSDNYGFNVTANISDRSAENRSGQINGNSNITVVRYVPVSDTPDGNPELTINESINETNFGTRHWLDNKNYNDHRILSYKGYAGPYLVNLYWKDPTYKITQGVVPYGATISSCINWESQKPDYPLHVFRGWYSDSALTEFYDVNTTELEGAVDLYGKWVADGTTFEARYHLNDGTNINQSIEIPIGSSHTVLAPNHADLLFTREGYTFLNWNSMANGLGETYTIGDSLPQNHDYHLYAQWDLIEYTITYHNLFDAVSPSKTSFNINDLNPVLDLEEPGYRPGYDFGGWYADDVSFTTPVSQLSTLGNQEVWAKWVENRTDTVSINVKYYLAEDDSPLSDYDTTVTVWAAEVLESNIFIPSGYTLNSTDPVLPTRMDDESILNVYLDADDTQTVEITVEYYFDNVIDDSETLTNHEIWAGPLTESDVPTTFAGYVLDSTTPFNPTLPATFDNGDTLEVYLVSDTTQTVEITVEYYFDNVIDDSETLTNHEIWAGPLTESDVPTTFAGYVLDSTTPFNPTLPATFDNGDTLEVYLVSDTTQTVEITVEYYFDNVIDDSETLTNHEIWAGPLTES
ncbi:InlB B-repeat-containing protein, partial [Methanimicrococcus blatticola]|uniref:InlB B-repeat-containing protein n=1 Tax=Methanimicrococcus blatticola TaxID=91560 RepID=UPI001CC1B6CA